MGIVTPNLDEVQSSITPGDYHVRVIGAEAGTWEKSGTPYIKWTLETMNSAQPKDNGRRVWDSTPISGKGAFRVKNFYAAATGEELTGPFDTEMLIGREMQVTVDLNDRNFPEVKGYSAVN